MISKPLEEEAISLGIVSRGDRPAEARKKIKMCFTLLRETNRRGAIIELCGTFERTFLKALANPVGEIRKIVEKEFSIRSFLSVRSRLVKDSSAYQTLDSQFAILENYVSLEVTTILRDVRNHRAEIAPGTLPLSTPDLSVDLTAKTLSEILRFLGID